MMNIVAQALIKLYALILSPLIGPSCRFQPTCSAYAHEALGHHGLIRGLWLTIKRIGKCQPFYKGTFYDPVPPKESHKDGLISSRQSAINETQKEHH